MSFLPATPNLERRVRLIGMTTSTDDIREGAAVESNLGLLDLLSAPGPMTGFTLEASDPALQGPGSYTEPVFGVGGGAAGGPFAIDVDPENGQQSGNAPNNNQILVAIAHDGAPFLMDFGTGGVQSNPTQATVGQEYDLAEDPDNGAWYVDSATAGAGITVRVVDTKQSNVDTAADPGPGVTGAKFARVEVVVLTPDLNG